MSSFGIPLDPSDLPLNTTPSTLVQQSLYALSSVIFSYDAPIAPDALDSAIALWSAANIKNAFNSLPTFRRCLLRSGAANTILGYLNSDPLAPATCALLPATALTYILPTLRAASLVPLALTVSALDYDLDSASLYANYTAPINAARAAGFPVLCPVSNLELQHMLVLNFFLARSLKAPLVFLSDGPHALEVHSRCDRVLLPSSLASLYNSLTTEKLQSGDLNSIVDAALASLNRLANTNYSQFEYSGPSAPQQVLIVYGSDPATQISAVIHRSNTQNVGVLKVRVPSPFNASKFVAAIPQSTRRLLVLHDSPSCTLKADVTASFFACGRALPEIDCYTVPASFDWCPATIHTLASQFGISLSLPNPVTVENAEPVSANTSPVGQYLFWGKDTGILPNTASKLALSLSLDDSKFLQYRTTYDCLRLGGSFCALVSSSADAVTASAAVDSANIVVIDDIALLSEYDVLATALPKSTVILLHHLKASTAQEWLEKLPPHFRRGLAQQRVQLAIINLTAVAELEPASASMASADLAVQVAFWRAALPLLGPLVVNKLLQAAGNEYELLPAVLDKFAHAMDQKQVLQFVNVPLEWGNLESSDSAPELAFFAASTNFGPTSKVQDAGQEVSLVGHKALATAITFPEAHDTRHALRPDLPAKTFVARVQQHQRLTPQEYSRNIFHIEFDITGTGLKYEIGEALGVHGRNDASSVQDFLDFYNVCGNTILQFTNREDAGVLETRLARQVLTENVDFLGKPPKRFYEALLEHATDAEQRAKLEHLVLPAGASDLKSRQDVDFSTYRDVLEEFTLARPPFAELVQMIAPLKRREYLIASSQKMHPNAVHLLVVVVDWVDSRGRTRYGHCSKYLSDLTVGQELVVSVKPSVMKLPPAPEQPIIMLGLGTGLAPFKAFVEEKIWQQQQGMQIGSIYLYLGSRHKKEEYLYGELWEAYRDAGILTHIGAAFSRDQPQKVYIQDKIRESMGDLARAIVDERGLFYLCGPTWPVPDITACLQDIVRAAALEKGQEIKDVAKVIEDMKEEGRYVLEVY